MTGTGFVVFRPVTESLPSDFSDTLYVRLRLTSGPSRVVTNTVAIAMSGPENGPSWNNASQASRLMFPREGTADLRLKAWGKESGGLVVWRVRVEHLSTINAADGVAITATLPTRTALVGWQDLGRPIWIWECACYSRAYPNLPMTVEPVTGTAQVLIRPVTGTIPAGFFNTVALTTTLPGSAEVSLFSASATTATPDRDPANNHAWALVAVEPAPYYFTPGWNLITLPLAPSGPLLASDFLRQLAIAAMRPEQIARWHNGWQTHLSAFSFNDFELRPGEACFVRVANGNGWRFPGASFEQAPSIDVSEGWTLLGVPLNGAAYDAEDILQELRDQGVGATLLARWHNGAWETHPAGMGGRGFRLNRDGYDRSSPAIGYFVKTDRAFTWRPSREPARPEP